MEVRYRVTGDSPHECELAAEQQAREIAVSRRWEIVRMDIDALVRTGTGCILLWEAEVVTVVEQHVGNRLDKEGQADAVQSPT